jgi:hypothetical protein
LLLDGLLGVYLSTLSTLFLTSDSADFFAPFFSFPADFEAAFFFPFTPPLTFGYPAGSYSNFFNASLPFS